MRLCASRAKWVAYEKGKDRLYPNMVYHYETIACDSMRLMSCPLKLDMANLVGEQKKSFSNIIRIEAKFDTPLRLLEASKMKLSPPEDTTFPHETEVKALRGPVRGHVYQASSWFILTLLMSTI